MGRGQGEDACAEGEAEVEGGCGGEGGECEGWGFFEGGEFVELYSVVGWDESWRLERGLTSVEGSARGCSEGAVIVINNRY